MPVTEPDLTINVYANDACSALLLEDTTGLYPVSPEGYGLTDGPAVNNVTSVVITVTYTTLSSNLVFTLTVVNGAITVATAAFAGGTPLSIIALISTTWPMTSANPFTLTGPYAGITLPDFEDGVFSILYNIQGTVTAVPFSFSTTQSVINDCNTVCCVRKKFADLDINDVDDPILTGSMRAIAYTYVAEYARAAGSTANANTFLLRAETLCSCDCGCE